MKDTTIMQDKFERAGILSRVVIFKRAIALFLNNGGTIQEAQAILIDIAGKMGGEGQFARSLQGQSCFSNAALQNDDDSGQRSLSDKANERFTPSSSPNSSAGQATDSDKARLEVSGAATPRDRAGHIPVAAKARAISPSPVSPSYIGAARKASVQVARSILDSYKVRDGRSIGDVTFGELDKMRRDGLMDASLFMQLQRHAANATPNQRVRDIVNADTLNRMVQKAAEVAQAS